MIPRPSSNEPEVRDLWNGVSARRVHGRVAAVTNFAVRYHGRDRVTVRSRDITFLGRADTVCRAN